MRTFKLLPSQQKELFDLIVAHHLDPNNFDINDTVSEFEYQETDFKFRIDYFSDGGGFIQYSPAKESYDIIEDYLNWGNAKSKFSYWLTRLREELSVPNVWAEIKELSPVSQSFDVIDDPFTPDEEALTISKVEEIKSVINKIDLPAEEVQGLCDKLDETIPLMKKLTKRQWLGYFNGALVSYLVGRALDSEILQQIWGIVHSIFNQPTTPLIQ